MKNLRKAYQRVFNKKMRLLNKNIANDNLWLGRFEFRQKNAFFEKFSDNSGGILNVLIRGYDKKTGYYKDFIIDFAPYLHCDWKLWEIANDFIVQDTGVWEETPRPTEDKFVYDYRKTHIPNKIMEQDYNFYLSYKKNEE